MVYSGVNIFLALVGLIYQSHQRVKQQHNTIKSLLIINSHQTFLPPLIANRTSQFFNYVRWPFSFSLGQQQIQRNANSRQNSKQYHNFKATDQGLIICDETIVVIEPKVFMKPTAMSLT